MHMDSKNIFDVSGKTIIITGAAGMLGTEYAKGLSEKRSKCSFSRFRF